MAIMEKKGMWKKWYKIRGPKFIWQRGTNLLKRYGLRPDKTIHRIKDCVNELANFGCAPTFPTPGIIVERYPELIRSLQDLGAEIAVHGFYHINFKDIPTHEAISHLERAVKSFDRFGIKVHGFRCPYLGYTDQLLANLPDGLFGYSSNKAFLWMDDFGHDHLYNQLFSDKLVNFYNPSNPSLNLCLPFFSSNFVEIPVCIPDDLLLYDGAHLDSSGIGMAWARILEQTYARGELFSLIFHTELASICDSPFIFLIHQARNYKPAVWIARLQDINDWWREKANFRAEVSPIPSGLRINFVCTPRATILTRGLDPSGSTPIWDGVYRRILTNVLEVPSTPRPFIGVAENIPMNILTLLQNQGYILDHSETASSCGIYLDDEILKKLSNDVDLINYIENSNTPLVRFWRWPDGTKSALCFTGDLDALTLIDYFTRILIK